MKFSEVMTQTLAWLQRDGRVSYRGLKLEFDLNDDVLDALKDELIEAKRVAIDENGKVLVWLGEGETAKGGKGEKGKESTEVASSQFASTSLQSSKHGQSVQPPLLGSRVAIFWVSPVAPLVGSARGKRCRKP